MELVFPIYHWSKEDVLRYLNDHDIDLPESYSHANHSLDCMDCTAWWGEGLSKFLEAKYPNEHAEYVRRIRLIKKAVLNQMTECEV